MTATRKASSGSSSSAPERNKASESGNKEKHAESQSQEENGQNAKSVADTIAANEDSAHKNDMNKDTTSDTLPNTNPQSQNWQAVWSAPHNAYYFWNSVNGQTTWVNPLDPQSSSSASTSTPQQPILPSNQPEAANDLDPELSFLDPTQYTSRSTSSLDYNIKGSFNSLTGKFMPSASSKDFSNTSERAKRQMGHYFDVDSWENQSKDAGRPSHRKHPTKKEIESYKEQKKERKKRGMGWLHS